MNQKGFALLIVIVIVTLVIGAGISGFLVLREKKIPFPKKNEDITNPIEPTQSTTQSELKPTSTLSNPNTQVSKDPIAPTEIKDSDSTVKTYWRLTSDGWKPMGTPPQCPKPFYVVPPADLDLATSVLYPGQYRSGNLYEPGGGFRFDKSSNDAIVIKVPADSTVVGGARFLVQGETQYVFDLMTPCGVLFRYDHLLVLSLKFQKIADMFPPARENDTRTTFLDMPVPVFADELIATAVGLRNNQNVFISWAAFDFREKNAKTREDASWAAEHSSLEHYATCPYDFLLPEEQKEVYALPASDGVAGSTSDFCK